MSLARRLPAATLAAILITAGGSEAHERSLSFSGWDVRAPEASVRLRVADLDLSRISPSASGPIEDAWIAYVTKRLELVAGEEPCEPTDRPRIGRAASGLTSFEWAVRCSSGPLRIRSRLFAEGAAPHLHFARVRLDGGPAEERVLSEASPSWALDDSGARGAGIGAYLRLGVEHILGGYDHLAFVVALLLIARSLGAIARIVTGFTIGHSLTLALAVGGALRPGVAIEALIGLSIALVAVENLWITGGRGRSVPVVLTVALLALATMAAGGLGSVPAAALSGFALFGACYFGLLERSPDPDRLRGIVAFLFGLLHGLGFASVLLEAELPPNRLARALLGFNAGVEVGQLAIVVLLWAALRSLPGRPRRAVVTLGSASVLAVGVFWFLTRTFG